MKSNRFDQANWLIWSIAGMSILNLTIDGTRKKPARKTHQTSPKTTFFQRTYEKNDTREFMKNSQNSDNKETK